MSVHSPARLTLALASAALLTFGLAACTTGGDAAPTATRTASASAGPATTKPTSAPGGHTPTPTPTHTVAPPTPLSLDCAVLITPKQMYDFNPNFAQTGSFTPASDSPVATVVAQKGTACRWQNESSGVTIEIAVAKPSAEELQILQDRANEKSHWVPTYGSSDDVSGYFSPGDTGVAQVFTHGYWLVADSPVFSEPGAAQPLVSAALGNLPD